MGQIQLQNIRVYAHHGCLKEETSIGSDYRVDLKVDAQLAKAAKNDDLADTVDYVHLNHIVKEEMASPSKLLEHVGQRIIQRIFKELSIVERVEVRVAKINPPIGGDVEAVAVVLSSSLPNFGNQ